MREMYRDRTGPTAHPDDRADTAPPPRDRAYGRRVECGDSPRTPAHEAVQPSRGGGVREPGPREDAECCGDTR